MLGMDGLLLRLLASAVSAVNQDAIVKLELV